MDVANPWVKRDEILSGTLDHLKNVPENYKVGRENGLDAVEDEPDLSDVDMCGEPNAWRHSRGRSYLQYHPVINQAHRLYCIILLL